MATYLYETIPANPQDPVRHFEVRQSMNDEPLKHDPETGLPVRRVITGGFGIMGTSSLRSSSSAASQGCCCGGNCQHRH